MFSLRNWVPCHVGKPGSEYNRAQVWVCLCHPFDIQLRTWSLRLGDQAGGQTWRPRV